MIETRMEPLLLHAFERAKAGMTAARIPAQTVADAKSYSPLHESIPPILLRGIEFAR
jgi:hypothetical protein